jgi:pyruvate formate lyase activating enzyme
MLDENDECPIVIGEPTFIDFPGKYAINLFFHGCNLRCGFCHNPDLVLGDIKRTVFKDILKKVKDGMSSNWYAGVVLTGGEPLINSNIYIIIEKLKELGVAIKLDTNGTKPTKLLHVLELLDDEDYLAIDFKTDRSSFCNLTGKADFNKFLSSLEMIRNSNVDYEVRTTIVREIHTPAVFKKMLKYLTKKDRYVLQGFRCSGKLLKHEFELIPPTSDMYLNRLGEYAEKVVKEIIIR